MSVSVDFWVCQSCERPILFDDKDPCQSCGDCHIGENGCHCCVYENEKDE